MGYVLGPLVASINLISAHDLLYQEKRLLSASRGIGSRTWSELDKFSESVTDLHEISQEIAGIVFNSRLSYLFKRHTQIIFTSRINMFSLGTSESAPEPYYRLTKASSPSPSTTSAPSSHSSPCTTDSSTMTSNPSEILSVVEDESLTSAIQDILERWNMGLVTSNDIDFLESLSVSAAVYVKLTERIDLLRHGVELIDHHIKLLECPTGLHENIASRLNRLFDRAYGDALDPLGSISNLNLFPEFSCFSVTVCPGKCKTARCKLCTCRSPSPVPPQ